MPLTINTNVASLSAQRNFNNNTMGLNKSLERLSSGFRINRASDDAAGLQISESLRSQIRGSQKALDNTQDGVNVLNIADGAMQTIQDNLQRVRELAVQAGNDTYATAQRSAINQEINALRTDIDRIANSAEFNGGSLLDGTVSSFFIQVGANNSATNDRISISGALADTTTGASGLNLAAAAITDNATAQTYIGSVDTALGTLNGRRATLGSLVNRLDSASKNLQVNTENLAASESRIRNVDVASESANMIKHQILQQASASILSQANQSTGLALSLIG